MVKGNQYNGSGRFAIRSHKLRLITVFLACAFCFLQQAAELHYVRTHSVRCLRGQFVGASNTPDFRPVKSSTDCCVLCDVDATILRPAAFPQNLVRRPDTLPVLRSFIAILPAGSGPDSPANPSSPRAPPFPFPRSPNS